ncbi:MAG TPA: hydrogenase [Deltaproteobacteria bacterium]|nr:hydrogenase [Deltaproteobacteria bacterium]
MVGRVQRSEEQRGSEKPSGVLWGKNGIPLALAELPELPPPSFQRACRAVGLDGGRLLALCVLPPGQGSSCDVGLLAVFADDARSLIGFVRTKLVAARSYPALTVDLPQAQAFERELFEEHGICPEGHPWLKPLREHADLLPRSEPDAAARPHPFFRVEGPGIHEVAVGPVHAGIIEPGHFRFQCHGEIVRHLEIQLGYQRRGAESLLLRSSPARRLVVAESIAGDTSVGHALAYCKAMEALGSMEVPLYAQAMRGIALELERVANHVGDLGALCGDVGYLPGASFFGRLRGEFLNLLMELSGNRFGRSLLRPGGVRFGLGAEKRKEFLDRLTRAERDLKDTAEMTFDTPTIGSRFEHTGVVSHELAQTLGLVGPAARASACDRDVRRDHPFGIYRFVHVPVSLVDSGDVMARALVRWLETQRSITFLREQLAELPELALSVAGATLRPEAIVVSMVEAWRGEIVHIATTGPQGDLAGYKIVDPSFHNWFGLAMALRGNQISDFPLCNKSFNLSYAGHDL